MKNNKIMEKEKLSLKEFKKERILGLLLLNLGFLIISFLLRDYLIIWVIIILLILGNTLGFFQLKSKNMYINWIENRISLEQEELEREKKLKKEETEIEKKYKKYSREYN